MARRATARQKRTHRSNPVRRCACSPGPSLQLSTRLRALLPCRFAEPSPAVWQSRPRRLSAVSPLLPRSRAQSTCSELPCRIDNPEHNHKPQPTSSSGQRCRQLNVGTAKQPCLGPGCPSMPVENLTGSRLFPERRATKFGNKVSACLELRWTYWYCCLIVFDLRIHAVFSPRILPEQLQEDGAVSGLPVCSTRQLSAYLARGGRGLRCAQAQGGRATAGRAPPPAPPATTRTPCTAAAPRRAPPRSPSSPGSCAAGWHRSSPCPAPWPRGTGPFPSPSPPLPPSPCATHVCFTAAPKQGCVATLTQVSRSCQLHRLASLNRTGTGSQVFCGGVRNSRVEGFHGQVGVLLNFGNDTDLKTTSHGGVYIRPALVLFLKHAYWLRGAEGLLR